MKTCAFCGKELKSNAHKNRNYCNDGCKIKMFRKKNRIPKTVHGEHYEFWKFLFSLTPTELQVLFQKRRLACKGESYEVTRKLKKEMKIISMVYEEMKNL